jgi:branched-chain amino acid transport system ATP-binding protein
VSSSSAGQPILHLDGLTKNFGALRATDDVTLDLFPGECHALIGPNGAGKSTLIHQVSGVLKPDAGRIRFLGRDITHESLPERARAGLGRTFQITAVIPSFSALENVALAAQATDGSSLRFFRAAASEVALNERAMTALEAFGLADRAEVRASDLSHGERRLLELAIALVAEPKALLMDEPMAGLGKAESAGLTETLSTLKTRIPILLVEHDMDAVFRLADRVSVLVYGAVVASGTPDQVRVDPKARAAYLGEEVLATEDLS